MDRNTDENQRRVRLLNKLIKFMSKNNRQARMKKVIARRGRTPIVSTHKEVLEPYTRISKGGVKHTNYKKKLVII